MKKQIYEEIIDIIDEHNEFDINYFYNFEEDMIEIDVDRSIYDFDDDKYYSLPKVSSREAYNIMVSYVIDSLKGRQQDEFINVLNLRKPFSRFNSLLRQYHYEDKFYAYKRIKLKEVVDDWMNKCGLTLDDDKLLFPNWEDNFSKAILERGYNYYEIGAVTDVKVSDELITSKVYNYRISIKHKNGSLTKLSCDCPCNFNCKHEAAVMYFVENEDVSFSRQELKENINYRKQVEKSLDSIRFDNDTLLDNIKNYFNSDAEDKKDFLNVLISKIIYYDHYYFVTRNKIMDYLIDIAIEYKDLNSLISIYKSNSLEEFKYKIIDVLLENYSSDEEVKKLLIEQEKINNFLR